MAKISTRHKSMLDNPEEVLTLAQRWLDRAKGQWKWLSLGLTLIVVVLAAWFIHTQIQARREAAAQAALSQVRPELAAPQAGAVAAKALDKVVLDYAGTKSARQAQLLRANLLYRIKNYTEAAKAYESLLPSGDPAWDAMVKESLSYCYEGLGDFKKAAATLKDVEEHISGPLKGAATQRLALLLEKSGDYKEAGVYWKKLLDQGANPSMMPYLKEKLAAVAAKEKK